MAKVAKKWRQGLLSRTGRVTAAPPPEMEDAWPFCKTIYNQTYCNLVKLYFKMMAFTFALYLKH